ncbi:MAG TPA: histidine kinase [Steroidobacteraceae bacterium]|jgi:hypothetical protein|nr:histidine kinase [Steroidobacteraceae bacterium]
MAIAHHVGPAVARVRSDLAYWPAGLFWLWGLFWLLMITTAVQDALRNPGISWWEPILWEGTSALAATCWMLIAARAREYYAQYLDRPLTWFGYHVRWLPLVVPTFIAAVYSVRHGVYELVGRPYHHPPWLWVLVNETLKLTLFAGLWLGILFGFDSYAQSRLHRQRLLELQKALTEAELARLKSQLRPHFFFNVLNTISALMHVDVARADRLVAGLGDLLHIALRSGEQEMTPLREELRSLELYVQIMQERFRDRVTLNWRVDPGILETPVPSLLLQPLLENAYRHGVERSTLPVRIDVTAGREGNSLSLAVSNTGSELLSDYREGVGLQNCRERLRIIYGEAAALQVRDEGGAVAARVSIPLTGGAT